MVLMYTGGTTGLPKGVLLDQRAEVLNAYHVAMNWGLTEDYVYLHQTPLFHAASMGGVLGIPACGATSISIPVFDPAQVLAAIEEHQVTMTVMVPTMVGMLLGHPDFRPEQLASLRTLTYGASPMPTALLEQLLEPVPRDGHLPGLRHDRGVGDPDGPRSRPSTVAAATSSSRPAAR